MLVSGGMASLSGPVDAAVTVNSGTATVTGPVGIGAHFVNKDTLNLIDLSQFSADDIENTGSHELSLPRCAVLRTRALPAPHSAVYRSDFTSVS
jgi:hypothetical protein